MIASLEDIPVFFQQSRDLASETHTGADTGALCLSVPMVPSLPNYVTAYRRPDIDDMVDLACEHHCELRHGIRSPTALARWAHDASLAHWVPFFGWTTLYARIQFGNERLIITRREET
ncbi:hypothetical protein F5Y19DRAFT_435770 [Xylariaceae sp. FL1651]|nr:hypothetical protein F5Y19DRAFT_435770 [Xylariaceae sp. FL1651]